MRTIKLEADRLNDRSTVHEYLKKLFELPEYYGKNLDALYDCLSEYSEKLEVVICGTVDSGYPEKILGVLRELDELGAIELSCDAGIFGGKIKILKGMI